MQTVTIIFRRSHGLGSLALRTILWSQWSHCGILDGDHVIEAAAGKGVVRVPLEEFKQVGSKLEEITVTVPDHVASKILESARSQIGKSYDYPGLFAIAVRHRDWHKKDRWTCSELVAWAFESADYPLVRKDSWRVTPQDIYLPFYR